MLRPERMSRVSVTGTKRVMPAVIEAVHDLNLVHLSSYDGRWAGFDPGDPLGGADETSDRLVTVRAIESILDVEADEAGPASVVADEYEAELESIRERVNELDDTRAEIRDRLRIVEDARQAAEPFVALGIDLDLLSGYDSLTVRVGEGDEAEVREALEAAEAVDAVETFAADGTVAAFAAGPASAVDEALVGATFTAVSVPDAEGPPDAYVADLEHERQQLDQRLRTVDGQLEELKLEAGRFLLAVEERLSIEVQKAEAPLSFATTPNAFVAEGWIPSEQFAALRTALETAAGDRVELEELERAAYDADGVPGAAHAVTDGDERPERARTPSDLASDGGESSEARRGSSGQRPDGGESSETGRGSSDEQRESDGSQDLRMADGGPPVVMDNPDALRPFELLVETINKPKYTELDPTVLVWLTFPTFFGFMIGDLGYGILYTAIGYLMFTRLDGPALKSLGGVTIWAGFFTMVFGVLYGEFFGLHVLGDLVWGGHPPIEKGLQAIEFALLWLVVAMVIGLVHVGVGYGLGFVNELQHSVVDAVLEKGSWFVLMFGVWIWIFSRHQADAKPDFVFDILDAGEGAVFALGFAGFSEGVGLAALGAAVVGLVLMMVGEYRHVGSLAAIIGPLESLNVLVNVLSYARITAVLLAKAGMAFVVNLLVFGLAHGHFALAGPAEEGIGLIHGGPASVVAGLVILVLGHLTVLALGITSAGLQAIRLEYVEFFQKFYDGGGEPYEPFGYESRAGSQ